MLKPPPAAVPCTSPITGAAPRARRLIAAWSCVVIVLTRCGLRSPAEAKALRSPPAQKKRSPAARPDHGPDLRVVIDLDRDLHELPGHRGRQGVGGLRTVRVIVATPSSDVVEEGFEAGGGAHAASPRGVFKRHPRCGQSRAACEQHARVPGLMGVFKKTPPMWSVRAACEQHAARDYSWRSSSQRRRPGGARRGDRRAHAGSVGASIVAPQPSGHSSTGRRPPPGRARPGRGPPRAGGHRGSLPPAAGAGGGGVPTGSPRASPRGSPRTSSARSTRSSPRAARNPLRCPPEEAPAVGGADGAARRVHRLAGRQRQDLSPRADGAAVTSPSAAMSPKVRTPQRASKEATARVPSGSVTARGRRRTDQGLLGRGSVGEEAKHASGASRTRRRSSSRKPEALCRGAEPQDGADSGPRSAP
jgi:hypothetical protein